VQKNARFFVVGQEVLQTLSRLNSGSQVNSLFLHQTKVDWCSPHPRKVCCDGDPLLLMKSKHIKLGKEQKEQKQKEKKISKVFLFNFHKMKLKKRKENTYCFF